jgi:YhcH/YjgK/YiaL family protein
MCVMIADTLDNAALHAPAHPLFARAFAYLARFDPATADGAYPLGDGSEARVMSYLTKSADDVRWESHRRFIDIQYVVIGRETILRAPIAQLSEATPYDEAQDVMFYAAANSPADSLTVNAGAFALFFPHDGHRPSIAVSTPEQVRKVVVKVPVGAHL